MPWIAGNLVLNPTSTTVLVSSGKLDSSVYTFKVYATANPTGIELIMELLANDDVTVLRSKVLPVTLAGLDIEFPPFEVSPGQTLRFRPLVDVTGGCAVEASLFYAQPRLGAKALG